jgi:uncharacterized repeat protein (TIGR03803 family)
MHRFAFVVAALVVSACTSLGPEGAPGPAGAPGAPGADGTDGTDGADGEAGPRGPQGDAGAQGPQGVQGPAGQVLVLDGGVVTGPPGSSVVVSNIDAGSSECPTGGVRVTQLSDAGISTICNGNNGATGMQGPQGIPGTAGGQGIPGTAGGQGIPGVAGTSTVGLSLGVGNANCPTGGSQFTTGTTVTYACNGSVGIGSLVNMTAEPAGANCPTGGTKLETGRDVNGDTVLQAGEVTQTRYSCNGALYCAVGGTLYAAGAVDPANPCRVCTPATSNSAFSPVADGTSCTSIFTGTCQQNVCLATPHNGDAFDVAVDGDGVYWTQRNAGTGCTVGGCVMSLALEQGSTAVALATSQDRIFNIGTLGGIVYWSNNSTPGGGVYACATTGCGGTPTAITTPANVNFAGSFSIGAGRVFVSGAFPASLYSVPLSGGAVTTLYTGPNSGALPQKNAVAGSTVYFAVEGKIISYPVGGGAQTDLVVGLNNPGAIAVSGSTLYFTELAGAAANLGTLKRVSLSGGTVTTLATGLTNPTSLATDGISLYVTDSGTGRILKLPVGGGPVTVYAASQGVPTGIALKGNSVYWGGSRLVKATPK